jgi:hypothetical protein
VVIDESFYPTTTTTTFELKQKILGLDFRDIFATRKN